MKAGFKLFALLAVMALCLSCERKTSQAPSFEETKAKAERGDAVAQYELGQRYRQGIDVPRDAAEAVKWYQRAAEQGYAEAQYNLAVAYRHGAGVARDDAEAVRWYRKAAEQGDAPAQVNLGLQYARGEG